MMIPEAWENNAGMDPAKRAFYQFHASLMEPWDGPASVAFNTTSSAELKEDLKSFDAGSIIDQTNVYDFKWKSAAERGFGVLAQQAIEVYPTAVTHLVNPEGDKEEYWGVDYSKYVPVLLQELKALRTRVAQLEGRLDAKPA
jgi:hypothetical protein